MENLTEIKLFFWLGSTLMVVLTVGIIALALFHQNRMLKTQRSEALLRMKAVLQKEHDERQRISSDLHDTVSGNLSAIRVYLSLLKNRTQDPEILEIVSETALEISQTQAEIRRISFNLMPPDLLNAGFLPSLKDYLRRSSARNEFTYTINSTDTLTFVPEVAYQMLQVLRELVTNSVHHGKSRAIDLTFIQNTVLTEIQYRDDGTAYDFYQCASQSTGSGLKNILFRLETLIGTLEQLTTENGNLFIISIDHDH